MKAKKLPSGSWRCRAYAGTDENGKRKYKSFTAATKKEAELFATQFIVEKEVFTERNILLKDAMRRYNDSKEKVLSPSTMKGYSEYAKNLSETKGDFPINKMTSEVMQTWISEWSVGHSPKTVRNIYGYVNSVLKFFDYGKNLKITLPQKVPVEYHIVTDDEIKTLLKATEGTELGIAVALAAFIPARRSEICALTNADIDRKKKTVRINKAMVREETNDFVIKPIPKTFGSNRTVEMPKEIIDMIPNDPGRIIRANPSQIEDRFRRKIKSLGLEFRFHDLRHYGATFLYGQVPDKLIMQRGGWDSIETLHKIYTHCLPEKTDEATSAVTSKFRSVME